jgi:hypothetical protein
LEKPAVETHMTKPEISGIAPFFIVNNVSVGGIIANLWDPAARPFYAWMTAHRQLSLARAMAN